MKATPMPTLRPLTPRIYFSGLYTGFTVGAVLGAALMALILT